MKEKLMTVGTLLCLFVLTSLLVTYALTIFPGVPAMRSISVSAAVVLGRLDAPAWVQAVGSVIAIFVAIGIPLWQRRVETESKRESAHAAAMVIGASAESRVHMSIATAQAILMEFRHPSAPDISERAMFAQALIAKLDLPTEEQMLLLTPALPAVARDMATGIAALRRVFSTIDFVASAKRHTSLSQEQLRVHYMGTRLNLLIALRFLRRARSRLTRFAWGT